MFSIQHPYGKHSTCIDRIVQLNLLGNGCGLFFLMFIIIRVVVIVTLNSTVIVR